MKQFPLNEIKEISIVTDKPVFAIKFDEEWSYFSVSEYSIANPSSYIYETTITGKDITNMLRDFVHFTKSKQEYIDSLPEFQISIPPNVIWVRFK